MRKNIIKLTGKELFFDKDDVIVSKTDTKGIITYANATFAQMAEITRKEAIGKPHNFIRHPHMPKAIFKLLWDTISSGHEIFAYVINRSSLGNEYWVLAHVTPSFDPTGNIVGFHSNRRAPNRNILEATIKPLYETLRQIEQSSSSSKAGLEEAYRHLDGIVQSSGKKYNHFIMSLEG